MGALKFIDDTSLKFNEDIVTLKFRDDGGGWPTIKFADDPTLKGIEDVKRGYYDTLIETLQENVNTIQETVNTLVEGIDLSQGWGIDPSVLSAQPFVLATPHHSMDWTKTFGDPNDPQVQMRQYEAHMSQLEQAKTQLTEQLKQLNEYHGKISKEFDELKSKAKKSGK